MDGSVAERLGKCLVDEAILIEQREPREARACDDHLKVVATTGAILDAELVRVRERIAQQGFESFGGHAVMLAARLQAKPPGAASNRER